MKRKIKIVFSILCAIVFYSFPVFAAPNNSYECEQKQVETFSGERLYITSFELEEGLTCDVYEIPSVLPLASGTITKTYDFSLSYDSEEFGYLRQITSWSYDGTNRPTLTSSSNTFYSYDTSKHYLTGRGSTTTNYGTSSRKYNRKADVYYNSKYIATTNFATICDKNGNIFYF